MKLIKTLALALALCQSTTYAADLFVNEQPRPFSLADKLEADATIGGYPIWAGEGKWRIVDIIRADSGGSAESIPMGTGRFFQTEGKNFVAAMEVKSNLRTGNGYWTGEPCKRDDMLFKSQKSGGREDNCVTINHITRYMSNPGGKSAELYAVLKEQNIELPPTVLLIQFTRNALSLRTLTFNLWVNPELAGFARESEAEWGRNPWHKVMAYKDPAKKQYIDALTAWALNFQTRMDDALKQKVDAFAGIPTWRVSVSKTSAPTQAPETSKITLD